MDHYEELGINRTASEEEIGRAHRRLTKLMHPDSQTDEPVKQLAEIQMRRLNSIVEVLSDPERRQAYDEELRDGSRAGGVSRGRRPLFRSWPWWVGSTVGAVVLTVGAVWFWADKWGSSFGNHAPTYIPSGAEVIAPPRSQDQPAREADLKRDGGRAAEARRYEAPSRTVASVPAPRDHSQLPSRPSTRQELAAQPSVVVSEVPRHRILSLPLSVIVARPRPTDMELPAAPLAPSSLGRTEGAASVPIGALPAAPTLDEPVTPTKVNYTVAPTSKSMDNLEGEWVYAPSEPEKRTAGFYPPEYINMKLDGSLHGQYHARYRVTGKPIAPDVIFALAPDSAPRQFVWQGSNGSKGTLKVSSMNATSIRIEWRTTVFGRGPALTAGTATLVRRNP